MTPPRRRPRARRSGYVLVFVAMLLFGLMAIAAITVDVGLARVTQSKMQTAADLAALEALRWRDADAVQARRDAALLVADPMVYIPERVVTLGPGLTDLRASALLEVPDGEVFVPDLRSNPTNEPHGDFVSGTFFHVDPLSGDPVRHVEDASYDRDDFTPAADPALGSALLARVRRTDGRNPLDRAGDPTDPDAVSSSGPALPFLFGMGSMIRGADPTDPDAYSPRHHGLTVRATAIARLRPVVVVGTPRPADSLAGHAGVALTRAFWQALAPSTPTDLDVDAEGVVRDAALTVVGQRYTAAEGIVRLGDRLGGDPDDELLAAPGAPGSAVEAFVPVQQTINGRARIIGFGRVVIAATATSLTVEKLPGGVAARNASAVPRPMPSLDLALVVAAHRALSLDASDEPTSDVITAPVLAR
ncbi:MAG: pilus assembly protein TadG-related protein [Planctomycetes bacterium]|nr:pilus assembly protein TadG-related protein [Planctomycetota bacterium]